MRCYPSFGSVEKRFVVGKREADKVGQSIGPLDIHPVSRHFPYSQDFVVFPVSRLLLDQAQSEALEVYL